MRSAQPEATGNTEVARVRRKVFLVLALKLAALALLWGLFFAPWRTAQVDTPQVESRFLPRSEISSSSAIRKETSE